MMSTDTGFMFFTGGFVLGRGDGVFPDLDFDFPPVFFLDDVPDLLLGTGHPADDNPTRRWINYFLKN